MLELASTSDAAVVVNAVALVLASALGAGGSVAAYLAGRKKGAKDDVKARTEFREKVDQIHEQVNNNHEKNLRDDLDERFGEIVDLVRSVTARMDRQSKDIGHIKRTGEETKKGLAALQSRFTEHVDGRDKPTTKE